MRASWWRGPLSYPQGFRPKKAMIDCEIMEVMECWPLEIQVSTESGMRFLSLTENITVVRGQETVSPGTLTPGMRIRVQLSSAPDEKNNLVDRVEITS